MVCPRKVDLGSRETNKGAFRDSGHRSLGDQVIRHPSSDTSEGCESVCRAAGHQDRWGPWPCARPAARPGSKCEQVRAAASLPRGGFSGAAAEVTFPGFLWPYLSVPAA